MDELEFGDLNVPYCFKAHNEAVRLEKQNRRFDAMQGLKAHQMELVKVLKNDKEKAICLVTILGQEFILKIVRPNNCFLMSLNLFRYLTNTNLYSMASRIAIPTIGDLPLFAT